MRTSERTPRSSSRSSWRLGLALGLGLATGSLLLAAGCNDEDKPAVAAADAGPDAGGGGLPDATLPEADGGVPDATSAAIPLTTWVNDLVTNFGPTSLPDTVDDKNIMDTDDPAAFDPLLQ